VGVGEEAAFEANGEGRVEDVGGEEVEEMSYYRSRRRCAERRSSEGVLRPRGPKAT
jgi:hypothetical protein